MSGAERCPKRDPRPGDVLRYVTTLRRVVYVRRVLSVSARKVVYADGQFTVNERLGLWRMWAATATVVHRAEPISIDTVPFDSDEVSG